MKRLKGLAVNGPKCIKKSNAGPDWALICLADHLI